MKPSPKETQNALLQLIFERGPIGARDISLDLVSELWAETALRSGDLLDALADLSNIGHLKIAEQGGNTLLSLTLRGLIAARTMRTQDGQAWASTA